MMKIALLVALLGCVAADQDNVDWGFPSERTLLQPEYWGTEYPTCYGEEQTPIVIRSRHTNYDESLGVIRISEYIPTGIEAWSFSLNTYTITLTPSDGHTLQFGETTYNLLKTNFLWPRSEHKIDHRRGDGGWRSYWINQNDANDELVLSIFLNAVESQQNQETEPIISLLTSVLDKLDSQESNQGALNNTFGRLFPARIGSYYKYEGSLATPPCKQGVTRIVTADYSVDIPAQLINRLQKLKDQNGVEIQSNTRPTQRRNGRIVKRSFN